MNVMNQISQQLLQEMPKTAGAAELAASMMSSPIDAWGDADMESVIFERERQTKGPWWFASFSGHESVTSADKYIVISGQSKCFYTRWMVVNYI